MRQEERTPGRTSEVGRLAPLGELHDLRVADGDTDIRGWDLCAAEGARLGRVDELIVDVEALKVRYLEVVLDAPTPEGHAGRRVLLPVGYAHVAESAECVRVDSIVPDLLLSLPSYEPPLTEAYENALYVELTGAEPGRPQKGA